MKNRFFPRPALLIPAIAIALAFSAPAPALHAAPPVLDYGDMSSATLTQKAWGALNSKSFDAAIGYTTKCIDTYKEKAIEQEKALGHPGPDKGQWALSDVATCLFIRGKAYEGQKKLPLAVADYNNIITNYPKAECADGQNNKWKPADPAKAQLALLAEFMDTTSTIVNVDLNSITVKDSTGNKSYRITMQTKIDYRGQPAHFTDLRPGLSVKVTPAANEQEAAEISADDPPKK